jgi:aminopeptidase-like protein
MTAYSRFQLPEQAGAIMQDLIAELYPICRSITGDGVRKTLEIVGRAIPLDVHEVPSGTKVLDWTVPREWNIRDAYVANSRGERVIDFGESNLHVVNYSVPVHRTMSLEDLRPHLHTLPDHPDWIPYRTTYYEETWGFCLRHRDYEALVDDDYEVVIDSTLEDGSLTYGELLLPGEREAEVLLTTHTCHPSMCNDNLSGIAVLTMLARTLAKSRHSFSYRLLFIPGTIGAITWLAQNRDLTSRIENGLVIAGVGDRGGVTYKQSRRGDALIDRAMVQTLHESNTDHHILEFSPYGYDERQFCSPGFNMPIGRFSRSEYATYPEYHTSADDPSFVATASLVESLSRIADVLVILENDTNYESTIPWGEPQLGKRGLYDNLDDASRMALLWVLNLSDGHHSLLDVATQARMPFEAILSAARLAEEAGLLTQREAG